jgi:hypothetical protein
MFQPPRSRSIVYAGIALLFVILLQPAMMHQSLYAQDNSSNIQIRYKNKQLDIFARDVDIKKILLRLAEITNIYIRFPASINKQITVNKSGISLKAALLSILRGFNHAIVYRRIDDDAQTQTAIAKVYVYSKSKISRRTRSTQRRTANRVRSYERQIESLRRRLSRVDANSRRGKIYSRRIKLIQKRIDALQR